MSLKDSLEMRKAKKLPDGTIREYSGMKYKKVNGKWKRYYGEEKGKKKAVVKKETKKKLKANKNSDMYRRGQMDAETFTYIPDFKDEQEKTDWTEGYRAGKEKQQIKEAKRRSQIADSKMQQMQRIATMNENVRRRLKKKELNEKIKKEKRK